MALSKATFEQVLDDLSSRFIINVPDEELASVERICFQIEQAHWFYEDFIRIENPSLPSFTLKNFSAKYILPRLFFQHCPLLHEWANEHETAFANFMEYKIRVPVCGAIILNEAMDKCILVKGWNARSGWGFPKGKINKDEPDITCAAREVWEETGFDVMPWIQEEHYVEQYMKDQRIRLYVIKGVPEDTVFVPQTRKEISKIEWHNVSDLPSSKAKPVDRGAQSGKESGSEVPNPKHPSRYFMVIPFVHKLKAWIAAQRKLAKRKGPQQNRQPAQHTQTSPGTTSRQEQPLSAQAGSDILKSMLGINGSPGSQRVEPHQSPSQQQQPSLVSHQPVSPPNNSQEPRPDLSKSSESLRELLGIGGMVEPSLSGQPPSSSSSSSSAAPLPGPSSGNSSDTLKALLGIPLGLPAPTSGSSPSSSPVHVLNPTLVHPLPPHLPHHYPHPHHAGHDSPRFQAAQPARMGYSPQLHHATATHMHHVSAPNSPHLTRAGAISTVSTPAHSTPGGGGGVGARKSSVDLLALLNSGGGGGGQPNGHHHAPQHPHPYHQHHQHQHPQQPFFPPMMNGFMPGPNGHAYPMNGGHHSNHGSPVLARQEPRYYHQQLPPQHQRTMSYPSPKMGYVSSPNLPSATPAAAAQSDHSGQGHGAKANKQQQQQQQSNGSNRSKGNTMRDFQFNMDGIV